MLTPFFFIAASLVLLVASALLLHYGREREWQEYRQELYSFKLLAVKRYYPGLKDIPSHEIARRCNVHQLYDELRFR